MNIATLQPEVWTLITNSLRKDRLGHAYLFEGERGTGKQEMALRMAQLIFCNQSNISEADCSCLECQRISSNNHPNVYSISPDGQSIKKEQIKFLQEEFQKKSIESGQKLYIINQADKMTASAANSLLKYLEEPFENTYIILLTSSIHQLLPTIISRCQVVSFRPLSKAEVIHQLIETGISSSKANLLANMTNSVEDARQLSQDEWFSEALGIVVRIFKTLHPNRKTGGSEIKNSEIATASMIVIQEDWIGHFKDRQQASQGLDILLYLFKGLLAKRLGNDENNALKGFEIDDEIAFGFSEMKLAEKLTRILEAKSKLQANTNQQLLLEQLVIRLQ